MFGNSVTVTGNVTRDPELRFAQSGVAIANLGLAWNTKRGEEEEVSFFNVVCFGSLAENVAESVSKGTRVTVAGQLRQRRWEAEDGGNRSMVEISANEVAVELRWATAKVSKNDTGSKIVRSEMPAPKVAEAPADEPF